MATKPLKTKEDGDSTPLVEGSGEGSASMPLVRGSGGRREVGLYKPPMEGL